MNRLLFAISILVLSACSPKVLPVVTEALDSTAISARENIVEKDVDLLPDSSMVKAILECDSLGKVYLREIQSLQGQRVQQSISLENNNLKVTANDQAREKHYSRESDQAIIRHKEIPVPYEVPVEVNKLTSWQAFQIWTGRLVMILIVMYAFWRFIKVRLNIIYKPFK